jgi:soluble lytic murein transglycosylase-like protein
VAPRQAAATTPAGSPAPRPESSARDRIATPYADTIRRVAEREGVDVRLVRAVIQVESGYQPNAQSPKGAMGMMQLMPDTARRYGVDNAYDPIANIEAGVRHLRFLLERFPLDLAIAAYNAGEAAVEKFNGIPPFQETRDYVTRVLRLAGSSSGVQPTPYSANRIVAGSGRSVPVAFRAVAETYGANPLGAARSPWRAARAIAPVTGRAN